MRDSTLKKVRHVTAYVIGAVLVSLGLFGLLSELNTEKQSPTDFFGYGLAGLLIAGGVLTCGVTWFRVTRLSAYVAGGVLFLIGIGGLLSEFNKAMPSSTNLFGYVLAAAFIVSGVLACIAARSHYGGDLWSFCGLICVAYTVAGIARACEMSARGAHLISPMNYYLKIAGFWGLGCYCLIWGHLRHRRQKKEQLPEVI